MHRNVLFDRWRTSFYAIGNYGVGAYRMEWVHNREPERSRVPYYVKIYNFPSPIVTNLPNYSQNQTQFYTAHHQNACTDSNLLLHKCKNHIRNKILPGKPNT